MPNYVDNPFKGKEKGKDDGTNEDQWNSFQRTPKDGKPSPFYEEAGDREEADLIDLANKTTKPSPFGGKSYN